MRALRVSLYPPDGAEPVSIFGMETDYQVPLEDVAAEQTKLGGAFHVIRIIDVDTDDRKAVTSQLIADQQERSERERAQALMYWWDAGQFGLLNDHGVLTASLPAPLSVDEIRDVLLQLAKHPLNRDFTIISISEDRQFVTLHNGDVTVEQSL